MNKLPLVSVIVTTMNEEENIGRFLKSVVSQSYENVEIIVVDNPKTTDATKSIAKEYTDNIYDFGPERSAQRNHAVSKASGDYVVILDADMELTREVLAECVDAVKVDPNISIVIPEWSVGESYWAKCKALERNFYYFAGLENVEAARFFKKNNFELVGGYDINMTGQEDWDLADRIFEKFPHKQSIKAHIIHHEGTVSFSKLMKKKYYYARYGHQYVKKHNVNIFSSKTLYFLRPAFYKNWKLWFDDITISFGTIVMLIGELIVATLGYLVGAVFSKDP